MRTAQIILVLFSPLAACYHYGELGNLGFELRLADVLYEFESGDRVLVGTRLCPGLGLALVDDNPYLLGDQDLVCFDESVTGPAQFDAERCWSLDTPGEVMWELMPGDTCLPNYPDFLGDRIRLAVVEPSGEPRLGFDDWRVRAPTEQDIFLDEDLTPPNVIGLAQGRTLADLREDPSAARRVVAGQLDVPMLRLDDDIGRIYFADAGDPADVVFELTGVGATPIEPVEPVEPEGYSSEARFPGERPLVLDPGAIARVRATLPGNLVLESPELIAVPPSDAASLDLVVMVLDPDAPSHAYAEVRDAQGRVLHAAPVEWSVVEGALGVYVGGLDNHTRTGDYAQLGGQCEPPSESEPIERHAVLRAQLGALEDTVELTWTEEATAPSIFDEPFVPDEVCLFGGDLGGEDEVGEGDEDPGIDDGGCACSSNKESSTGATGSAAWLGLAALLFVRRRRSRR